MTPNDKAHRDGCRRARRVLFTVALLVLLAAGLVGVVAHFIAVGPIQAIAVVAVAPYLMLGAVLAVLGSLVARRWRTALVAGVLVAAAAGTQAPLYISASAPQNARQLTVLTSNLRLGFADAHAVVAAVRRHRVDVLMLEELTPREQHRLVVAGLNRVLTHHVSQPRVAAEGTGLWSRYPLTDVRTPSTFTFAFITARVAIPGVRTRPTLVALHLAGPYPYPHAWHADVDRLPAVLHALPDSAPVVVGGDFNATPDSRQFRAVLTSGFRDGAEQAGAGLTRTYPADRSYPPLLAIDHVLTRDAVATAEQTVQIEGSDHRALLASVAVPQIG